MRHRPRLAPALVAALAAASLVLAACDTRFAATPSGMVDPGATPAPLARPPVPRACVFESCHGRAGDSIFTVDVPARWNGTLLLWVPGFVGVRPVHTGRPPALLPRMSPAMRQLFDQGYAVAEATYDWNGWSVAQSITAAEVAYRWVRRYVGVPHRVYAWGVSMGGLVSLLLAERHPDWVTAAAPACGVLGGTVGFYDLAVDALFAVHALLDPRVPVGGFRTYAQASAAFHEGRQVVLQAARGTPRQQALVLLIGDLLHAAPATTALDVPFQVGQAAQSVVAGLTFGTFARWEMARAYRGEFATNAGVDYGGRLDTTERTVLERLSPGVTAAALGALAVGGRVTADRAARDAVAHQLDPTGLVSQPVVTMHDEFDPVVPLEHEGAYGALAASRGRADHLLQLVTVPARGWTGTGHPVYGVGHCRFTQDELVGQITVLDQWVTTGVRPSLGPIVDAYDQDRGVRVGFPLPAWPGAR